MIDARVKINEYSNRVFGVVKAKYGLKDKSEAINKFVEMYGDNEIEPEIKREYLKKLKENGIYSVLFMSPIFPEITSFKEIFNKK